MKIRLTQTRITVRMTPRTILQPMSFFSMGSRGSWAIFSISSEIFGSSIFSPYPTSGGFTPWKNNQEINKPIQMMNPNRQII